MTTTPTTDRFSLTMEPFKIRPNPERIPDGCNPLASWYRWVNHLATGPRCPDRKADELHAQYVYERDRWNWNPPFEGAD